MTGKEKCEFLKGIRKRMAEANGIPYEPRECNFEGGCSGTCPFCEKEAADLLAALKKKESKGEEIKRDEFSTLLLEKGKMEFDDAYEAFALEVEQMREMFKPVGRIRCNEEDVESQQREIGEMKRIMEEQERPLMGDIDDKSYRKAREEKIRRENERIKKESRHEGDGSFCAH